MDSNCKIFLQYFFEGLNIISSATTICGFIYGFFWLKAFKEQKRLENRSTDARIALDEIVAIEQLLGVLLTEKKENLRYDAWKQTPSMFIKLSYTLLLLRENPKVENHLKVIQEISTNIKGSNVDPYKGSDIIKSKLDWDGINKLTLLKEILLKIYDVKY